MKKRFTKLMSLALSFTLTVSMSTATLWAEEPDFAAEMNDVVESSVSYELSEETDFTLAETTTVETPSESSTIPMEGTDTGEIPSSSENDAAESSSEDGTVESSPENGTSENSTIESLLAESTISGEEELSTEPAHYDETPLSEEIPETADFIEEEFLPDFAAELSVPELSGKKSYTFDSESFGDVFDSNALFEGYANQEFGFTSDVEAIKSYCGDNLTGTDAKVYSILKKCIEEIASGSRTSTQIEIPMTELGFPKRVYGSDLGIGKITTDPNSLYGSEYSKITNSLLKYFNFSPVPVGWSVVRDCPYECYWFDLTFYFNTADDANFYYDSSKKEYYADFTVAYDFEVNKEYRGSSLFQTNPSKTSLVKTALKNAKKIINTAASYSDLNKLIYYRDRIIALTDYNYDAAAHSGEIGYGDNSNPWQIIWVFDENAKTKVVCEGYAKSFKYLCDNTKFDHANIQCYWAKGQFGDGSWSDYHSWNIVHMSNGQNYLVDLTNCDDGGSSVDPSLFMAAPIRGNVQNGYWFSDFGSEYLYDYDLETTNFYAKELLTLASKPLSTGNLEPKQLSTPTLTSVSNGLKGVTIKWKAVSGAEKYRVFRKVPGGKWTRIGLTTSTSFTDKKAVSGTKYYYTVRCTDITASIFTSSYNKKGLSITYIAAPVLSSVTNVSTGIKLTWKASAGAGKYRISRKTGNGDWVRIAVTSKTSYIDTKAVRGKKYTYTVRCLNAAGTKAISSFNKTGLTITRK